MHEDAKKIIEQTIVDVMPDRVVRNSLNELQLRGDVSVIAVGKAAWVMAKTASVFLKDKLKRGLIITKYGHSCGDVQNFEIVESGHPTPDENSVKGAKKAIELLKNLQKDGTLLLLLSGGGSSLMELPVEGLTIEDIQKATKCLLYSGADITEINKIRKKLSAVKGGKFSTYFKGIKAYAIILSDIICEQNDMIASGLTYPDVTTAAEIGEILQKYQIKLDDKIEQVLFNSVPCTGVNVENYVVGSVAELCKAAAVHAQELGYTSYILTTSMNCEAWQAGKWIASMAEKDYRRPFAVIAGGETVVRVTGSGKGGRNQEIALSAALELKGKKNVLLFSIGSDGTDGPTDAAGGIVDGQTALRLEKMGIDIKKVLKDNDSYHALQKVNGLIKTGATGTNVNDVTVLLCR